MPQKIWSRADDQEIFIQSSRGTSFTMNGAIDDRVGLRYYSVFEGSNNKTSS